jgi:hypothetical protein
MNTAPTIFVSVASYRDKYCSRTLESIYENARAPDAVFVGLCIQNDVDDEDCGLSNPALTKYRKQIRTIRLKHYEAKGPTWARYLCASLMDNEDYFMQVDSHTLFEKDWDVKCVNMIRELKENTESVDVVISHYPPNYSDHSNDKRDKKLVDTICQSFFNDRGMVSFMGAEGVDTKKYPYVQTPHIAAGMFFCEGKCLREVPYDPNLPNLFVGEEILHSARVWTAGYDIYTPTELVVYHLYTRSDQPHVWDDNKSYNDTDAFNKVKLILGFDKDGNKVPEHVRSNIDKYGLGQKRTLKEYLDFAGIDVENKRVTKNFCPHRAGKLAPAPGKELDNMENKSESGKEGFTASVEQGIHKTGGFWGGADGSVGGSVSTEMAVGKLVVVGIVLLGVAVGRRYFRFPSSSSRS